MVRKVVLVEGMNVQEGAWEIRVVHGRKVRVQIDFAKEENTRVAGVGVYDHAHAVFHFALRKVHGVFKAFAKVIADGIFIGGKVIFFEVRKRKCEGENHDVQDLGVRNLGRTNHALRSKNQQGQEQYVHAIDVHVNQESDGKACQEPNNHKC